MSNWVEIFWSCCTGLGAFTAAVLVLGTLFLVHGWLEQGEIALYEVRTLRARVKRLEQMVDGEDDE